MTSAGNDGLRTRAGDAAKSQERCSARLDELLAQSSALIFACIGTADGRLVAARRGDGARTAAMTSSLLALSESFAKEALRSPCMYSTIVTRHGCIVTVRIPSDRRSHVLSVGADATETLAMVLRHALDAAAQLAEIIDSAT